LRIFRRLIPCQKLEFPATAGYCQNGSCPSVCPHGRGAQRRVNDVTIPGFSTCHRCIMVRGAFVPYTIYPAVAGHRADTPTNHGAIRRCTFHDPAFALLGTIPACARQTDGQTDGRTDTSLSQRRAIAYMLSRVKRNNRWRGFELSECFLLVIKGLLPIAACLLISWC